MELKEFYPYIKPHVCGAPSPVVDLALIATAREFCKKTHYYQSDIPPVLLADEDDQITLCNDMDDVICLTSIQVNGCNLDPITRTALGSHWVKEAGMPRFYYQDTPRTIKLHPVTKGDDVYEVDQIRVALMPALGAKEINCQLFDYYAEELANGALSVLYAQSTRDWYNPEQHKYRQGLFKEAIGCARAEVARGFTNGPVYNTLQQLPGTP